LGNTAYHATTRCIFQENSQKFYDNDIPNKIEAKFTMERLCNHRFRSLANTFFHAEKRLVTPNPPRMS